MHWELSDEQVMFQDALRSWLTRDATPDAVRGWLDAGDPEAYERALVGEGWFGVGTREDLGGQGGGLVELALAAEAFGRAAAPSSAWLATVLAVPALAGLDDVLASALEKGRFAGLVVPAGSAPDAPAPFTVAGELITGAAAVVLGADRAGLLVVPVGSADGTQLWLVDAGADGVDVTRRSLLDRTRTAADVALHDARGRRLEVDADAVLAQAALRAAVLVSADALGVMGRMLDLAVDYSRQREQFGVPIGSFQAVKHAAAGMLVSVESARSIVYYAAASVDDGTDDAPLLAAAAKAQVTADAARCADTALTVHGAIGYTWEYDLQLYYKRAKLDATLFGPPAAWNERLAAALPLRPGDA